LEKDWSVPEYLKLINKGDIMSRRQTTEQERAKQAWSMVESVRDKSKYKAKVNGAPALIQSCGLGPALAFMMAKGDFGDYPDHLAKWILKDATYSRAKDLMKEIMDSDSSRYREMTMEAFAITNWLKRFAATMANNPQD
jgi:CRISPR type III-B/RAMP module-associated protein Cmr5